MGQYNWNGINSAKFFYDRLKDHLTGTGLSFDDYNEIITIKTSSGSNVDKKTIYDFAKTIFKTENTTFLTFIEGDDDETLTLKFDVETFLTSIAGTNLSVSNGKLNATGGSGGSKSVSADNSAIEIKATATDYAVGVVLTKTTINGEEADTLEIIDTDGNKGLGIAKELTNLIVDSATNTATNKTNIGTLTQLPTTNKTNIVGAITELYNDIKPNTALNYAVSTAQTTTLNITYDFDSKVYQTTTANLLTAIKIIAPTITTYALLKTALFTSNNGFSFDMVIKSTDGEIVLGENNITGGWLTNNNKLINSDSYGVNIGSSLDTSNFGAYTIELNDTDLNITFKYVTGATGGIPFDVTGNVLELTLNILGDNELTINNQDSINNIDFNETYFKAELDGTNKNKININVSDTFKTETDKIKVNETGVENNKTDITTINGKLLKYGSDEITSIIAGTNITATATTGALTINASGGGTGGISEVKGTTGEIDVATGTTAPVISLDQIIKTEIDKIAINTTAIATNKTDIGNINVGVKSLTGQSDEILISGDADTPIINLATKITTEIGKIATNATDIGDITTLTTNTKTDLVKAVNEVNAKQGLASQYTKFTPTFNTTDFAYEMPLSTLVSGLDKWDPTITTENYIEKSFLNGWMIGVKIENTQISTPVLYVGKFAPVGIFGTNSYDIKRTIFNRADVGVTFNIDGKSFSQVENVYWFLNINLSSDKTKLIMSIDQVTTGLDIVDGERRAPGFTGTIYNWEFYVYNN